jgi:hypothetical protein
MAAAFDYNGFVHTSWQPDEYSSAAGAQSRAELAATNANWAAVLATWYQPSISANAIAPDPNRTPTDAGVTQAVQDFHERGIRVMLKPHVDVNDAAGSWRGLMKPSDPDAWFAAYTLFLVQYARMAASLGVEMLCIGTELRALSGAANRERWNGVIDSIRAVYGGALTYAANAVDRDDEFTAVSFWDRVDLIGLDAYFPLTKVADPTLAQLVAAWRRDATGLDVIGALESVYESTRKPIVFTEIGYKSSAGANTEPWNFNHSGGYDPIEQRHCYDAAFTAWRPYSAWMKGMFWWHWPVSPPGAADTDYNPRGKPAAGVFRGWQSPQNRIPT